MGASIFFTAAMIRAFRHVYNKKTKGPTVMELFTITGKVRSFFDN
jgi:hypothetical protein